MKLNKRAQEFAERNCQLRIKQVNDDFRTRESEARFYSLTNNSENSKLLKLLPQKLKTKGQTIIDCYFEAFQLDGQIPDRDDQAELDKKLENIFCNGHGDYTGSLPIGVVIEIQALEKDMCEQMRVRAERMALEREVTIEKLKIRWSQLPKPTVPDTYRVPGIGDIAVSADDIKNVAEIGGDVIQRRLVTMYVNTQLDSSHPHKYGQSRTES